MKKGMALLLCLIMMTMTALAEIEYQGQWFSLTLPDESYELAEDENGAFIFCEDASLDVIHVEGLTVEDAAGFINEALFGFEETSEVRELGENGIVCADAYEDDLIYRFYVVVLGEDVFALTAQSESEEALNTIDSIVLSMHS